MQTNNIRSVAVWLALICALVALLILLSQNPWRGLELGGDFVQYWSAGRLNIHGENPYNLEKLTVLQSPYHPAGNQTLIMWLPPWMYILAMPIGLLPYPFVRMLWFFGQLAVVVVCTVSLWKFYGGQQRWLWLAWCVSFLHWAMLEALRGGQISHLMLAGVIVFLISAQRNKPWLAGAALALVMLKPHLLYLFILALILWGVEQRQWRVLTAWALTLGVVTLVVCLPNPGLLGQYLEAARQRPPGQWITATLGGQLRLIFGSEKIWLQFAPLLIGLVWLVWYWLRHRQNWHWCQQIPVLALMSLSTAAYGWRHDQSITLLAILPAFVWLTNNSRKSIYHAAFIGVYILIDWVAITTIKPQDWFWWFPLVTLIWYLGVRRVFYEQNSDTT